MATIKVLAGGFLNGGGDFYLGQISLKTEATKYIGEKIPLTEIETLEIATEDSVKRIGGTVGWGAAGAVLLGPAGVLAGLLWVAGRRK